MSSTASKSEIPGWYVEFLAALLRQAPRPGDIDQFIAEGWTQNQASLKKNLAECLVPPATTAPVKIPQPKPTLLELLGTVKVGPTDHLFNARSAFVVNTADYAPIKISEVWSGFKDRFLKGEGKVESAIAETELRYHRLKKRSVDGPILEELGGGQKPRTTLTEVYCLMAKQPNGPKSPKGPLLTNGYANIFYVETEVILPEEEHLAYTNEEGKKVVLCAVRVHWRGDGWHVDARSVEGPHRWDDGYQVFSRNSALETSDTPAPAQA